MQQNIWDTLPEKTAPLADRMRPRDLDEFCGQTHIVGEGRLLRRAIMADRVQSCIFWGPPGCGKTTLAGIIANMTGSAFEKLNAVTSGVADVRRVLSEAKDRLTMTGRSTILLLDECHRWSKSQSDSILPAIESGLIRLIGSTTENPMASMTPAIVSRCRLFEFHPLTREDIIPLLERALKDPERGLGMQDIRPEEGALEYIARMAGGDVRNALSALELAVLTAQRVEDENGVTYYPITLDDARESVQKPVVRMGEGEYYDMISAFIKSMRGSDPDAALLWFARMIYAGVDPRIIVRRMIVHASEDVGLAEPVVMLQAHAAAAALETVGMPEAQIPIAQAIIAISMAEKSNSVSEAIGKAMRDARDDPYGEVPEHLRDKSLTTPHANTPGYRFPHNYPEHFVKQNYMPAGYEHKIYYVPGEQGHEARMKVRLEHRFGDAKKPK